MSEIRTRFRSATRISLAALAATLAGAAALPAVASAATNLGAIGFGTVAVDDAHQHVFVSGLTGNVIDELDYSGNLIGAITNVPGPSGLLVGGQYLYFTESTAGTV